MPQQSIIAWDLETVPDLAAAARMLDLNNASEAEVRQALGSGFPKHPLPRANQLRLLLRAREWMSSTGGARLVADVADSILVIAVRTTMEVGRSGRPDADVGGAGAARAKGSSTTIAKNSAASTWACARSDFPAAALALFIP